MSEHTPEPLIYAAWVRALKRRLVAGRARAAAAARCPAPSRSSSSGSTATSTAPRPGATCRQTTARRDLRRDGAARARRRADRARGDATAPRLESWRWGDAHQALHLHQTLGNVPVLQHLVNIRQSTPGGDHTLLRGQTPGDGPEPYLNVHAAGFRARLRLLRPGLRASSSSRPARAGTCSRATTTTSRRSGGGRSTSRCRSTRAWRGPARSG